jgi:hypothetical protein
MTMDSSFMLVVSHQYYTTSSHVFLHCQHLHTHIYIYSYNFQWLSPKFIRVLSLVPTSMHGESQILLLYKIMYTHSDPQEMGKHHQQQQAGVWWWS